MSKEVKYTTNAYKYANDIQHLARGMSVALDGRSYIFGEKPAGGNTDLKAYLEFIKKYQQIQQLIAMFSRMARLDAADTRASMADYHDLDTQEAQTLKAKLTERSI